MAADPYKQKPGPLTTLWNSERWWLALVVGGVLLALGAIAAVGRGSLPWLSSADPAAPHWVTLDAVRGTTSDGKAVKAKVAMDAPDAETRAWLNSRPRQLVMLMQISVSEHDARGASGSERVQRLAADMEDRVNQMLAAGQLPPVRDVVIQDLVISTP